MCSVRELGLCNLQTMCMYLTDYCPIEWHYFQFKDIYELLEKNDNNDKIYRYMTRYLSVT